MLGFAEFTLRSLQHESVQLCKDVYSVDVLQMLCPGNGGGLG